MGARCWQSWQGSRSGERGAGLPLPVALPPLLLSPLVVAVLLLLHCPHSVDACEYGMRDVQLPTADLVALPPTAHRRRADWKACAASKAEEEARCTKFKELFKPFDPSLE